MGKLIRATVPTFVTAALWLTCSFARADLKYSQSGTIMGSQVAASVARPGSRGPEISATTTYVKGPWLRIDLPDGSYGIIDLRARREIQVDPKNRTYLTITFGEIRSLNKAPQSQVPSARPRFTTKAELSWTGRSRVLLHHTTRELVIKLVDEPIGGRAPQPPDDSVEVQSWIAPSIPGFSEVRNFYTALAAAIGWTVPNPSAPKGAVELFVVQEDQSYERPVWVPLMTKAILDLYGSAKNVSGLPMLQTWGLRVRSGEQQPGSASWNNGFQWALSVRVTSYSTETLDRSLFQIPANYCHSHSDPKSIWILAIGQL